MIKNLFEVAKGPAKLGKSEKSTRQASYKRSRSIQRLADREDAAQRLDSMGPDARLVPASKEELRSSENDSIKHAKARGRKKVRGKKPKTRPITKSQLIARRTARSSEPKPNLENIEPTGHFLIFESDWMEAEGGMRRSESVKLSRRVGQAKAKDKMKDKPVSPRRKAKAIRSGGARAVYRDSRSGRGVRKQRGSKFIDRDNASTKNIWSSQKDRTLSQVERTKEKANSGKRLP